LFSHDLLLSQPLLPGICVHISTILLDFYTMNMIKTYRHYQKRSYKGIDLQQNVPPTPQISGLQGDNQWWPRGTLVPNGTALHDISIPFTDMSDS
jgi:hypothetical protein